jgi:hypothetical protein
MAAALTTGVSAARDITATSCVAIATASVVTAAGVATAIAVPATIAVSAAQPRTGADEDAAVEPVWPIESIGRAGIRRVVIVAVGACRRTITVARIGVISAYGANADSDRDLRMGVRCRDTENCEQSKILEIPHSVTSRQEP